MVLRGIDRRLPERIIREAERVFVDTETGYWIALAEVPYGEGSHLMMVAFEKESDGITAITIHPLSQEDVDSKLRSGRWEP